MCRYMEIRGAIGMVVAIEGRHQDIESGSWRRTGRSEWYVRLYSLWQIKVGYWIEKFFNKPNPIWSSSIIISSINSQNQLNWEVLSNPSLNQWVKMLFFSKSRTNWQSKELIFVSQSKILWDFHDLLLSIELFPKTMGLRLYYGLLKEWTVT